MITLKLKKTSLSIITVKKTLRDVKHTNLKRILDLKKQFRLYCIAWQYPSLSTLTISQLFGWKFISWVCPYMSYYWKKLRIPSIVAARNSWCKETSFLHPRHWFHILIGQTSGIVADLILTHSTPPNVSLCLVSITVIIFIKLVNNRLKWALFWKNTIMHCQRQNGLLPR